MKITVRNKQYYYNAGVYYNHGTQGYTVIAAPIGARIKILPAGYTRIVISGRPYFHYYGAYYLYDNDVDEYYVVACPAKAAQFDTVTLIDGEVLEGRYLGGDGETIDFQVDDDIYEIPVEDVISLKFEPPTGQIPFN